PDGLRTSATDRACERLSRRTNPAHRTDPDALVASPGGAPGFRPKRTEMTTISATLVKELRELTGAGMMDCKQALAETNGDIDAAVDWLRKKGISKADKKAG